MSAPPEYMYPLLHSIESTIIETRKEFIKLNDKDIEFVYDQLKGYFQKKSNKKDIPEPLSSSERRQILIDEVLNILDAREEMEGDDRYIMNPDYQPNGQPIPNLHVFYATAFNHLIRSIRFWKKKNGNNGYIRYISDSLKDIT